MRQVKGRGQEEGFVKDKDVLVLNLINFALGRR